MKVKLPLLLIGYSSTDKMRMQWPLWHPWPDIQYVLLESKTSGRSTNFPPTLSRYSSYIWHKWQFSIQHIASSEKSIRTLDLFKAPRHQYHPISVFLATNQTHIRHNWMFSTDNKPISSPLWKLRGETRSILTFDLQQKAYELPHHFCFQYGVLKRKINK